jgi:phage terminase large subunit-like protein
MAGRGFGKNFVSSNWLAEQAMSQPGTEWAIVGPTWRDSLKTCIEGPTGILKALLPAELAHYRRNELQVTLSNGSVIHGYSADQPERLRGANLSGAACDELGSWRRPETWTEALLPALRIGQNPRIVVTTTPRPTALIRELMGRTDGSVHLTRGSTWENAANLSGAALTELRRRYEGTRLGRQELEGELLDDFEGALWKRDWLEAGRVRPEDVPDLTRIIVAVDPSGTAGGDEWGVCVAGEDGTGHGYVLADLSRRGSPDACMRAAVAAYHQHHADRLVAETNFGGDFIEGLLRNVDPDVPYTKVTASRGKAIRAEPVSALFEQGRVHLAGIFPELEDELCTWSAADPKSPNRLDALVWAVTELRGISAGSWADAYVRTCTVCGHKHNNLRPACPACGQAAVPPAPGPAPAGSIGAAYGLARCDAGHSWSTFTSDTCPKCPRTLTVIHGGNAS